MELDRENLPPDEGKVNVFPNKPLDRWNCARSTTWTVTKVTAFYWLKKENKLEKKLGNHGCIGDAFIHLRKVVRRLRV
ncbi:hypothetical protein T06_6043 [Trichinella sp. T6]|uniref:Uncharacterized protein n=1 Tax=Trichinella murrelli TaxID=144512 RepID=A0A0V0UAH5_9BILA|nr:hypothetical protein T05_6202 [Trichinella murrelli]KRX77427.1 hypothetical protein T06_6043 [Trichinella sp. T6]